jgi:hypothetical protein
MTRISSVWPALFLTLLAHQASAQSTPSQAPPKLEKIEEVDDGVTITSKQNSESRITEKRDNSGNVTEATVKSGPSTYTLRPNHPAGTALPGDALSGNNRGPQWTVLEFDLGGKKKKKTTDEEAAQDSSTNAPPPPAVK